MNSISRIRKISQFLCMMLVVAMSTTACGVANVSDSISVNSIHQQREYYAGRRVAVSGIFIHHEDEPLLFQDMAAIENIAFDQSLVLEFSSQLQFADLNEKQVVVHGVFVYFPEPDYEDYYGFVRVDRIEALAGQLPN